MLEFVFFVVFLLVSILVSMVAVYFDFRFMLIRYNKRCPEEYRVPVPKGFIKTLAECDRYHSFVRDRFISDFYCPIDHSEDSSLVTCNTL